MVNPFEGSGRVGQDELIGTMNSRIEELRVHRQNYSINDPETTAKIDKLIRDQLEEIEKRSVIVEKFLAGREPTPLEEGKEEPPKDTNLIARYARSDHAEGIPTQLLKGLSANWHDELKAKMPQHIARVQKENPDFTQQQIQDKIIQDEREKMAIYEADHPVLSAVAEISGALLGLGVTRQLAKTVLPRLLAGSGILGQSVAGGGYGGLYFAGGAEGGPRERASEAGIGTAIGAVLPPALHAGGRVVRGTQDYLQGTARQLGDILQTGKDETKAAATRLVAGVGTNAQQLLNDAARRSKESAELAKNYANTTFNKAMDLFNTTVDDALGVVSQTVKTVQGEIKTAAQVAGKKFNEVYSTANLEKYGDVVKAQLITIQGLSREIANDLSQLLKAEAEASGRTILQIPLVEQLHMAKTLLADAAKKATPQLKSRYFTIAKKTTEVLEQAMSDFKKISDGYAQEIEANSALQAGINIVKKGIDLDELENFSQAAKPYILKGVRLAINDIVRQAKGTASGISAEAKQITELFSKFSSDEIRIAFINLLGKEKAESLLDALSKANQALQGKTVSARALKRADENLLKTNAQETGEYFAGVGTAGQIPTRMTIPDLGVRVWNQLIRGITGGNLSKAEQRLASKNVDDALSTVYSGTPTRRLEAERLAGHLNRPNVLGDILTKGGVGTVVPLAQPYGEQISNWPYLGG